MVIIKLNNNYNLQISIIWINYYSWKITDAIQISMKC